VSRCDEAPACNRWCRGPSNLHATDVKTSAPRRRTRGRRKIMGQLVDEIIALIALGDTRHPDDSPDH
jgi:hypothetical protein